MANAELLFGRNIGARVGVSEADFAGFVASEITPRFPDGVTVIDAKGQWRDERGSIVREPSKVVLLVFEDDPARRSALDAIAEAYKRAFNQRSVLISVRTACVSS